VYLTNLHLLSTPSFRLRALRDAQHGWRSFLYHGTSRLSYRLLPYRPGHQLFGRGVQSRAVHPLPTTSNCPGYHVVTDLDEIPPLPCGTAYAYPVNRHGIGGLTIGTGPILVRSSAPRPLPGDDGLFAVDSLSGGRAGGPQPAVG